MAYQVNNHISCSTCVVHLLETLGPKEKEQLLAKMFKATQERQSHTNPALKAMGGAPPPKSPKQTTVRLTPVAPRRSRNLLPIASVAVALLIGVLVLVMTLAQSPPTEVSKTPPPESRPTPPSPATLSATESAAHDAARNAVRKAKDVAAKSPRDLEGQNNVWRECADLKRSAPHFTEAQ